MINILENGELEFAKPTKGEDIYWLPDMQWLVVMTETTTEIFDTVPRGTRLNCDESI